jgi:hypothetical protein
MALAEIQPKKEKERWSNTQTASLAKEDEMAIDL